MKRTWFRELLRRRIVVILLLVLQALFIAYVVSSDSRMAEGVRIPKASSIPKPLSLMTKPPRWERPIWIFGACISTLSAVSG